MGILDRIRCWLKGHDIEYTSRLFYEYGTPYVIQLEDWICRNEKCYYHRWKYTHFRDDPK